MAPRIRLTGLALAVVEAFARDEIGVAMTLTFDAAPKGNFSIHCLTAIAVTSASLTSCHFERMWRLIRLLFVICVECRSVGNSSTMYRSMMVPSVAKTLPPSVPALSAES